MQGLCGLNLYLTKVLLRIAIERCYGMSRFISSYADVVRIPAPVMQPADLKALALSCQRFMEKLCSDRDIALIPELSPEPLLLALDSAVFEQVLLKHGCRFFLRTHDDGITYFSISFK